MRMGSSKPAVIGFGNPTRSDDAVGFAVVRAVRQATGEQVSTREVASDAMNLLTAWEDADTPIVVDAMVTGAAPGSIRRFQREELLSGQEVTFPCPHGLGLLDAVRLAAAVGRLPERLVVFGIEGRCFDLAEEMSPAVEAAVAPAVGAVLKELNLDGARVRVSRGSDDPAAAG